ncbi:Ig-like domain-containing protein [Agromyces sp. NBRC 114283]|uniref:Ig-like domain-containing protein n=1 Tax=Agromyces sp. NBRC 114283 TaxID=2994521 RepID=UPI0024A4FDAA|nr:Ig-like domain-containing protein [Agromyces sp. NBRC 114283]GLU89750.1 fibronectin type III [Agromyces sp. NBRC 114283]
MGFFGARRRTIATATALAVLAGVPVGFAVLHQGFPVTDPDLRVREVWVTNAEELQIGRLNRQIDELDAAVATAASETDVLQHGLDAFAYDPSVGSLERIDPAFTTLVERIDVPPASTVAYGGDVLAVLSPKGELWAVPAGGTLSFDWRGTEPLAELGAGADVAVSERGTIFASDPKAGELLSIERGSETPAVREIGKLGDHELAAVGERAVVLERERGELIVDGRRIELPEGALRLQQSGPEASEAVIATDDALLFAPLGGGEVREVAREGAPATEKLSSVAAPVRVGSCVHGAWAESGRYLAVCDGEKPRGVDLEQSTAGGRLEFRVNRDVVVLNNLANGDAWLLDSELRLVDNWEEVTPPEETDELEGDEKSAQQTFEDTLAERTEQNRPPVVRDDDFGVRPGRTTIVDVLANDTDPDGDVLTVARTSEIAEAAGRLDLIDGGRALQFTPVEGAAGTVSFRYTADDGRGGVAEANVNLRIVPDSENQPPAPLRNGATSVEQGQQISYNLLADWTDPDGDDLFLVDASPTSGDVVRASPDGFVTFEHKSAELGLKEVAYTVSDGRTASTGKFTVDVKPAGELNPIGTPDFAQAFVGENVLIEPLLNDLSPSGAPVELLGVPEPPERATVTPNPERGTIAFSSNTPGEYVFLYDLGAGANVSVGLIRVQVVEPPADAPPPIAVKDTAYLRPGEPTSVSVLANDVSPSGRVLAVQSIDDSGTDDLVSVELLTNTVARVSASEALDRQLQFSYTVSDGVNTATSTVTVVPVPPLVKHQPPVALDDSAIVRAGDIVTVPVLANDYHPDAAPLHLDPELDLSGAPGALAFTDGEQLRFQAPREAGVHTVVYTITDDYEQIARAAVTFTVVGTDAENRAPLPTPLTSRTFAGSAVTIDVPLDGIDPDGDSVVLTGIDQAPALGRILERTSTSFTYQAFAGGSGTDEFRYVLQDTKGEQAVGTIRIGVIPRPEVQAPPNAVDDAIEMKPGRTVGVDVLLNDSDPSGYSLHVAELPEIDEGIEAEIRDRRRIVVTAPEGEGAYTIRYAISNGHGGTDTAFLQLAVSEDAVIDPPTAEDQVLEPERLVAGEDAVVDPLKDATNPGGLVEDLVVSVEGPNANRAEVAADGTISVRPGRERYAVAFRLTNELDELSAMAFVIVPPVPDGDAVPEETQRPKTPEEIAAEERAKFPAPYLKNLGEIVVPMNGSIEWSVSQLVEVPSGQPATVLSASATNSRSDVMQSSTELRFQPATDYRGPATVTFEVTDGKGADDPVGRRAILSFPVTVGDPGFNDVAPTFTPRNETIEAGEAPLEIDLRQMTDQPNPDNIAKVSYTGLSGQTQEIQAEIVDGATLRMQAPLGVQPGASTRLSFQLGFNEFTVPGYVDVKVVSSTRAKPRAVADPNTGELEVKRGGSVTVPVLENDFNPFAQDGVPLRVVAADVVSVGANATASFTPEDVTIRTGSAFTGTVTVNYRIEDGTKDPSRQAQGQVTVVVRDVPDAPGAPAIVAGGDGRATIKWSAPANNNAAITGYDVLWPGGSLAFGADAAGKNQVITGLTNGRAYTFQVRASNKMGDGGYSNASASVTPWGTPSAPTSVRVTADGNAPTTVRASWNAPTEDGGGQLRYQVRFDGGGWQDVPARAASFPNQGAGTHTVEVRAVNGGNNAGPGASDRVTVNNPPPPSPSASVYKGGDSGCCRYVAGRYSDFTPGSYTVTVEYKHWSTSAGWTSMSPMNVNLGTGGTFQTLSYLGEVNPAEFPAVRIRFQGPGGTFYSSVANWGAL